MTKTHLTYPEARAQLDAQRAARLPRDAREELRLTLRIAESPRLALAAEALSTFADKRADERGPFVKLADGRSFETEIAEELADARNYLVWWLRSRPLDERQPHDRRRAENALRAVVQAYAELVGVGP